MSNKPESTQRAGRFMLSIFWVLVLISLSFAFGFWEEKQYNPNQNVSSEQSDSQRIVKLKRNRAGHYVASGKINGHDVRFMLDTGATNVAVPEVLAKRIGLLAGRPHQVHTANGIATAYQTNIPSLQLGSIQLKQLSASITTGMKGEDVLLGMSALKQLDFSQSGDVLTLIQYK
ncbi:TIGR02281 family clan AA aspartic protease [Agaribacterium sp. ZY112]|uniref:retropepsin-like aspartic protease family protein n=1 Tax=Agaribacterium sp. ZY112 TaxID=3233574 RepID=UPI00352658E1